MRRRLALAQAQLAKDSSLLEQAQANLARFQTLEKQDSIARQQVDDQAFAVAQDKAAVGADQAQIDTAKLNISYCRIVAPISGRVGLRLVDAGNYLQPSDSTGIVVITQLDPISVVFSTAEDNLPRIAARLKSGAKLPVTAYDRSNTKSLATGELTTFDNQIDTTTGTVKLRAQFANPDDAAVPQPVRQRAAAGRHDERRRARAQSGDPDRRLGQLRLCREAGFHRRGAQGDDRPGRSARTRSSPPGWRPARTVVIDGVDRLRDGAKVIVRNGGGDAAAATGAPTDGATPGPHRRRTPGPGGSASPTARADAVAGRHRPADARADPVADPVQ